MVNLQNYASYAETVLWLYIHMDMITKKQVLLKNKTSLDGQNTHFS